MPKTTKSERTKPTPPPTDQMESSGEPRHLLHTFNTQSTMFTTKTVVIGAVIIIFAGIASGFGISRISGFSAAVGGKQVQTESGASVPAVVGIDDVSDKDDAVGKLVPGGLNGEGTHHLERPGGPSQNVYLTSSVVSLDDYLEQEVHVWGDTFAAQAAGWFMDVVRLEVE